MTGWCILRMSKALIFQWGHNSSIYTYGFCLQHEARMQCRRSRAKMFVGHVRLLPLTVLLIARLRLEK